LFKVLPTVAIFASHKPGKDRKNTYDIAKTEVKAKKQLGKQEAT
jgi:hypothetical protein